MVAERPPGRTPSDDPQREDTGVAYFYGLIGARAHAQEVLSRGAETTIETQELRYRAPRSSARRDPAPRV
jgi:hypothetical protein